jgi:UPF0755 protein
MPKNRRVLKRVLIVIAIIVLVLIIAAASALIWYQTSISAVRGNDCSAEECKLQDFTVKQDEGAQEIATNLEKAGIIRSAFAFRIYLTLQAENKVLLPGEYKFSQNMSVEQIVKSLNKGIPIKTIRMTFLPGETIQATRKRFIDIGFTEAEVDAALAKQYNHELLKTKPASASLEGYIWGDTYEFYADESVENILIKLFDQMLKVVKEEGLVAKYEQRGFTLHQGITLASIIQREAPASYEEKRHIAQVFETRLSQNIVLGSDAIIAYAADQINPNRDKSDMSYLSTINCPWNSRRCQGLPPTPISSPNRDSLKAVADPTNTQDYYFLTGDDGKMYYSQTEAGHNANIKNYCKKMCQIL